MRNAGVCRERQQKTLIFDVPAARVLDIYNGVDGKAATQAFMVDGHDNRGQLGSEIFVEISTLAGVAVGDRTAGAVALDPQARRIRIFDSEVEQIRKLFLYPCGLEFIDARHLL